MNDIINDCYKIFNDLKEYGDFYISAIELDHNSDGEVFEERIDDVLMKIKTFYETNNINSNHSE